MIRQMSFPSRVRVREIRTVRGHTGPRLCNASRTSWQLYISYRIVNPFPFTRATIKRAKVELAALGVRLEWA